MIISHLHRFVFAAIPKTGTHSVRGALRERMGAEDHEQVKLFVKKSLPFAQLAALGHGHISLSEIRPFLGEAAFASYFKFAFVRNPFDRFISNCAFLTREEDGVFERDPASVMRYFLHEERPLQHLLLRPQHTFIADASGKLLTDAIGRVETMQASYDAICQKIGIESTTLAKVNSTQRGDYRRYYDRDLMNEVADVYRRDLELFGYSFDGGVQ